MTSILDRTTETLRDEGFTSLSEKAVEFAKYNSTLYQSKLNGGYEITINGESAELSFSDVDEVIAVKYIEEAEDTIIRDCLDELNADDVVWEVGAHIGVHSCIFGKRANEIVSIEPYPPNVRRLRENLERNDVTADVVPIALSDRDGTEELSVPETDSPGDQWPALLPDSMSESRRKRLRNDRTVETDVKKGDTLVDDGVRPPTVVKIDVEGSSQKVLQGMRRTLKRDDCRLVYIEVHLPNLGERRPSVEDFGQEPEAVQEVVEEYGFDTQILAEREADFFVKGVK